MAILSDNGVPNAGFLMGATAWAIGGGGTGAPVIHESGIGAPGRAVMAIARTGASGGGVYAQAPLMALGGPNRIVEVQARVAAGVAPALVQVLWYNITTLLSTTSAPAVGAGAPAPVWGVADSFNDVWFTATPPASATHASFALAQASGSTVSHWLSRPAMFVHDSVPQIRTRFDPGPHTQTDLQLAVWPRELSYFLADQTTRESGTARAMFMGDSGVSRPRTLARKPRRTLSATLRCDPVQVAILESFHAAQGGRDFWLVDPVDDTLCRARFGEKGPEFVANQGFTSLWRVQLETRVA